jgi:hypothetical protein
MPRTRSASSGRGAAAPKKLYGITEARLSPEPLRQLSRRTSYGYDVIDFAEAIGQPLIPWQAWAVKHALEVNRDGTYRFRIILIMVARQSGKSHLMRMITLWRMLKDEDCRLTLGTAQDLAQASNQWKLTLATINETPWLARRLAYHRHVNGQEAFGLENGSEYLVRSANANAGRGFSVDGLIMDELRTHRDSRAWSALFYTTMARPNPLVICLSNAGDDESVVLNQLRDAALSGRDPTIGLFEWSGPDNCELDDWNAIRQANPGLGHTVSEAAIRTALAAERPSVFRTEVLCQKVDQLDGAVDLAAWQACADAAGTMDSYRQRLAACFDMAPDGQHCTLAVAALMDDGRPRVEVVKAWKSSDEARAELPGLLDRIKPQVVGWYPTGPAAALAPILRVRPGSEELTGMRVAEICQGLADLARSHGLVHADQDLLNAHIQYASKIPSGDGWRFARRGGPEMGHVDAAYAAAGAVNLAQVMPPPRRAQIRIVGLSTSWMVTVCDHPTALPTQGGGDCGERGSDRGPAHGHFSNTRTSSQVRRSIRTTTTHSHTRSVTTVCEHAHHLVRCCTAGPAPARNWSIRLCQDDGRPATVARACSSSAEASRSTNRPPWLAYQLRLAAAGLLSMIHTRAPAWWRLTAAVIAASRASMATFQW